MAETKSDRGKLRNAFVLLQCSQKSHNDCRRIRDAFIDNSFGYVQEAYTTDAVINDVSWCVAASALIPTDDAEKFEKRIQRIRTKGKVPVRVKRHKLLIDESVNT